MRPSFFTKRYRLVVLFGLATILALVLVGRWLNASKRGGQGPAEPFRIAGNLYYGGATDAVAFLIAGPEGHIVLDGGCPESFIDPAGYHAYINAAEAELRSGRLH